MLISRTCYICLWLTLCECSFLILIVYQNSHLIRIHWMIINRNWTKIQNETTIFSTSSSISPSKTIELNDSNCWTDSNYEKWKEGKDFPLNHSRGNIIYMIMTGNAYLRSRCDVMMCTFGMTLHPSRLLFVGETSNDSRLPIYDVIRPGTRRPVDHSGSMQKLGRGLAMIVNKINKSNLKNEIDWIMVMDDDTFILPFNLQILASQYDSRHSLMIGQATCGIGFCGDGGYLISKQLFNQFPSFIERCRSSHGIYQSDQFVPLCIQKKSQVQFIDRLEFHSQSPDFYTHDLNNHIHPHSFGQAVTFHYVRPALFYLSLWQRYLNYTNTS